MIIQATSRKLSVSLQNATSRSTFSVPKKTDTRPSRQIVHRAEHPTMNVPAVNDLQQKLSAVMEELDHKVFRPQQVFPSPPSVPDRHRARSRRFHVTHAVPTPASRPPMHSRSRRKPRSCARRSARTCAVPRRRCTGACSSAASPSRGTRRPSWGSSSSSSKGSSGWSTQCQDKQAGQTTPDTKKYENASPSARCFTRRSSRSSSARLKKP